MYTLYKLSTTGRAQEVWETYRELYIKKTIRSVWSLKIIYSDQLTSESKTTAL